MPACPISKISRFEPFAALARDELELVSRFAHRLLIPKRRWLLRPGRSLRGHHFLLKGTVATVEPAGIVSAGERAASRALYPGVRGLRTLSDCEFMQIPTEVFDLLEPMPANPLIVVGESTDCWQARLLDSELMTPLPLSGWQQLLSRLEPRPLARGALVVREGEESAASCFILAAGTAKVFQGGRLVNQLAPGDLFGEDALITREPRNATVQMQSDGRVMVLAARYFRSCLAHALEQGIHTEPSDAAGRMLVRFGSSRDLRERIGRLTRSEEYLVSSAQPGVEALALYLMRKRGLTAWAAPRT